MEIKRRVVSASGIKFYVEFGGREVGRSYLYVMTNDLHDRPFGFMEDVFVDESLRGHGLGTELVRKVIEEARMLGCYKLICTSRHEKPRVHELYLSLNFRDQGKEFRIDF